MLFPVAAGAIKTEETAADIYIRKKRGCLHREVTYFLLNKISSGYGNQLGYVILRYYTAPRRGGISRFNEPF